MNHDSTTQLVVADASVEPESTLDDLTLEQTSALKRNMYDLDEDDLAFMGNLANEPLQALSHDEKDVEEDSTSKVASSNPWVMAKMNARIGKTNLGYTIPSQPMTPVRDTDAAVHSSSSPIRPNAPRATSQMLPYLPTPRASSPMLRVYNDSGSSVVARPSMSSTALPGPDEHRSHSPAPALNVSDIRPLQKGQTFVMGASPLDLPQAHSRPRISQGCHQEGGISLDQIPDATSQQRCGPLRKPQKQYTNKPFKPPVDPERDAWFRIPEAHHSASQPRRARQQKSSDHTLMSTGEPFDCSQPKTLSPPPNNTDIRNFISASKTFLTNQSEHTPPEIVAQQLAAHVVTDENTFPTQTTAHSRAAVRLAPGPSDFVLASELDLAESPSPPPLLHGGERQRPLRRRKTGERTLVEVTGNSRQEVDPEMEDDPSYEPGRPATSSRCRRTTDEGSKPHRTKSSLLPLERVPTHMHMQSVHLKRSFLTEAQLEAGLQALKADVTLGQFNEPAIGKSSILQLEVGPAEVENWTATLVALLEAKFPENEIVGDLVKTVRENLQPRM